MPDDKPPALTFVAPKSGCYTFTLGDVTEIVKLSAGETIVLRIKPPDPTPASFAFEVEWSEP